MFGLAESVFILELLEILDIFEAAIAIGGAHGKRPIASGLIRSADWQTDYQGGNRFAGHAIAIDKLFGGPGLQFGNGSDYWILFGRDRNRSGEVRDWRGNFELGGWSGGRITMAGLREELASNEDCGEDSDQTAYNQQWSAGAAFLG
jgi:hypothetical protein